MALVAWRGKGYGTVGVSYNGKLVSNANLAASKSVARVVIALPKMVRPGTIQIRVLTTGKTVRIDGLVTARV